MNGARIGVAIALMLLAGGCGCGESDSGPCPTPGLECCLTDNDCASGPSYMECCLVTHECVALPDDPGEEDDGCDPGYTCDDLLDIVLVQGESDEEGCLVDWSCCEARDELSRGKIGTHSSIGIADDGTIWLSGYGAGTDETHLYGDLAAGTWNATAMEPDWVLVDGVPWDEVPYAPPGGWRGGINVPGDDVGMYTSLELSASDVPRIAYYDATNGALRFVTRDSGDWGDPVVVDDAGEAGKYASMVLTAGDVPAVAYRAVEVVMADYPGAGYQVGTVRSIVRYAVASDAAGSTWTVTDVTARDTPCWGNVCGDGPRCRVSDGACWPENTAMCAEECAADQACLEDLDGSGVPLGSYGCQDALAPDPVFDLPDGIGIWNSLALAPGGTPEVVFYDRTAGALVWVADTGTGWGTQVILDGDDTSADPLVHGDRGWHPTLAIDATGTRHIAYVDGLDESLVYMQVDASGTIVVREVVDDGTWGGTGSRDLVGDYSSIAVDSTGAARIAYQNTTQGLVMLAVRSVTDGSWTLNVASDPAAGFMGYYINQLIVSDVSWISQFTFNYEMEPNYRGLRVMSCSVDAAGAATCL